ncbi:hypothetical protein Acr_28g0004370 [Actinidia rufa]|uniref:Uncharacterized protein n=1 Tax=Actinidia rufa TaxID=165716 RepID=A0A7J0H9E3_9ERIC|nr:hypothetical protein Acr_28g0004370 [Actinidia rufa]
MAPSEVFQGLRTSDESRQMVDGSVEGVACQSELWKGMQSRSGVRRCQTDDLGFDSKVTGGRGARGDFGKSHRRSGMLEEGLSSSKDMFASSFVWKVGRDKTSSTSPTLKPGVPCRDCGELYHGAISEYWVGGVTLVKSEPANLGRPLLSSLQATCLIWSQVRMSNLVPNQGYQGDIANFKRRHRVVKWKRCGQGDSPTGRWLAWWATEKPEWLARGGIHGALGKWQVAAANQH